MNVMERQLYCLSVLQQRLLLKMEINSCREGWWLDGRLSKFLLTVICPPSFPLHHYGNAVISEESSVNKQHTNSISHRMAGSIIQGIKKVFSGIGKMTAQ